ncbi:hypothetical protein BDQ17DRAFT_96371 [Cyathus striatus]|nr:hypothetical protein BDQ17DRAFT_96371 [Cyathus striatus]
MPMDGRKTKNGNADRKSTKPFKGVSKQKTLLDHFKTKPASGERPDHAGAAGDAYMSNKSTTPYTYIVEDFANVKEVSSNNLETESKPACSNTHPQEFNTQQTSSSPFEHTKVERERDKYFTQEDTLGNTQFQPIVVDSSPLKKTLPKNSQFIHPFFARTRRSSESALSTTTQKRYLPNIYPTSDIQHVKGTQSHFPVNDSPIFSRRNNQNLGLSTHTHPHSIFQLTDKDTYSVPNIHHTNLKRFPEGPISKEMYFRQIPESHMQQHPAIASVLCHDIQQESLESDGTWVNKWRPRRAVDVLTNESNAVYLRNWLQALELKLKSVPPATSETSSSFRRQVSYDKRGTKRPRIVRAVEKRGGRKRQRVDSEDDNAIDFIAYDPFGENLYEPRTDGDAHKALNGNDLQFSILQNEPLLNQVYNTIVLTGPSGSGKTASVYACAEELGWKVFEVYPGIGKRNGANLDILIGDVGKNHILSKEVALPDKRHQTPLSSYEGEVLPNDTETPVTEQGLAADNIKSSIQQSVILLEEVDILFKEDANFWPAVVKFISQSRRPVVCTCNDISLVPVSELPLQAILTMEPCSPSIAASYLQSISCAEGYMVEREALLELCSQDRGSSGVDGTLEVTSPDLRKSIQALQLWCTTDNLASSNSVQVHRARSPVGAGPHDKTPKEELSSLQFVWNRAEYMSFADSEMTRKPGYTPMSLQNYECTPGTDDEMGHLILFDRGKGRGSLFGMYDHDEEIASTGAFFSRGMVEAGMAQEPRLMEISRSSFDTDSLLRARLETQNKMDGVLRQVCPANTVSSGSGWLYTDYLPWIRHLLVADDEQEQQHMENRRGRMTKNSGGYVRTITLTEEGRKGLEWSSLDKQVWTNVE